MSCPARRGLGPVTAGGSDVAHLVWTRADQSLRAPDPVLQHAGAGDGVVDTSRFGNSQPMSIPQRCSCVTKGCQLPVINADGNSFGVHMSGLSSTHVKC
jgi:hypothetical protein